MLQQGQIVPVPRLTYEDYCALPDNGKRYEIIDGELYMSPSPVTRHQRISRRLGFILVAHVEKYELGEVFYAPMDVVLSPHDVVEPDILFVAKEHRSIITEKFIDGAPDLLVEILSPSTRAIDRVAKLTLYAKACVRHYWILDPDANTLEAFVLDHENYRVEKVCQARDTFKPSLFPGLTVDCAVLFA